MNNGYNPTWREQFCFPLYYPELALLYITVKSGDMKQAAGKSIADKKVKPPLHSLIPYHLTNHIFFIFSGRGNERQHPWE